MTKSIKNLLGIGAGVALLAVSATAGPVTGKTSTGQSIMVNLTGAGTYSVVDNQTWKFDAAAASALFSNDMTGGPTAVYSSSTSGPTTTFEAGSQPVTGPCDPTVIEPSAPAPDATVLYNNAMPGHEDVVGSNACALLGGGNLSGATYNQSATASASCTFVTGSTLLTSGPNAGSYKIVRRTVTKTGTFTWSYTVAPLQASYDPFTAWTLESSTGSEAQVSFGAFIAGESATSSSKVPRKYSFSLGEDITGRLSRVQGLTVTVDGIVVAGPLSIPVLGSTVSKNTPDAPVDFSYVGNAGSNGNTALLVDGDARGILNGDNFLGNDNGGADGESLAIAVMDDVTVSLAAGDHTVTLTGTVKDNVASVNNISFTVNALVHIIAQGCGGAIP